MSKSLWDATFRARLLRQALSTDEIAQAVEAAEGAERSRQKLADFAEWLVAMDDPEDVLAREERREITLDRIIQRARKALT